MKEEIGCISAPYRIPERQDFLKHEFALEQNRDPAKAEEEIRAPSFPDVLPELRVEPAQERGDLDP